MFGSGRMFDRGRGARRARPAGGAVGRDRRLSRLHGLDRPLGEAAAQTAFYLGGGYKYAMSGEGCAFMHAPPGFGDGRRITGWFAEFEDLSLPPGQRRLCQGCDALPRRDLRSVGALSVHGRSANAGGERPDNGAHLRAMRGASTAIARSASPTPAWRCRAAQPPRWRPARALPRLPQPDAQRWYAELKARNCITDVRGDVLRVGFGIYQDETDVDRLVELLGGLSERPHPRRAALARPGAAAARLHLQLSRPADPRHPRRVDHRRSAPHRHAVRGARRPAFALLYSVLGIPFAFLADRTSRSRVIAASLALWSAFTALCGWRRPSGSCSFPDGRRHRRSGRSRAILRADRRLFPAAAARAGNGDLLARRSDRPRRSER